MQLSRYPVKVAITGGLCSGKSTFLKWLEEKEFLVFKADQIGHKLLNDQDIITKLTDYFGESILTDDSLNIDKKKLSEVVFNDDKKLKYLNSVLHPEILINIDRIIDTYRDRKLLFFEIPLLFETKIEKRFELTLNLSTTPENQLKRIKEKFPDDWEEVKKRTRFQLNDPVRMELAHLTIDNNGTIEDLRNQFNIFCFFIPYFAELFLERN